MTEPLQITKSIGNWLSRSSLSLEDLNRMSPHQQAAVGRQWQSYQADISRFQANSGVKDAQLPQYSIASAHAVPRLEGNLRQPVEQISTEEYMRRRNEEAQQAIAKHTGRRY